MSWLTDKSFVLFETPLLIQVMFGVVFWTPIWIGYRTITWWQDRETRRNWDPEAYQRARVAELDAEIAERKAARRQTQFDRMIDWQIETGIPFEDLEHEELERIALGEPLGEPDLIITFPIRPTRAETDENETKEDA